MSNLFTFVFFVFFFDERIIKNFFSSDLKKYDRWFAQEGRWKSSNFVGYKDADIEDEEGGGEYWGKDPRRKGEDGTPPQARENIQ